MITKKTTRKMEEKLLKIIFKRYTKEYGYGVRNLAQYQVLITGGSLFEDEMPEIVEYENNTKRYRLLDLLKELMARGYIECSEDNVYYWLTESGYKHALQNTIQRVVTYFTNNAGWTIIIAICSFIVSVIALVYAINS